MTKYDERFKLKIVQEYIGGAGGSDTLGRQYGVPKSLIKLWAELYRIHGCNGRNKKHSSYNAEFKLSVLRHMWDNGLNRPGNRGGLLV